MRCNAFIIFNANKDKYVVVGDNSINSREELTRFAFNKSLPIFFAKKAEVKSEKIILEREFYAGKLLNKSEFDFESIVIILDKTDGDLDESLFIENGLPHELLTVDEEINTPGDALKIIEVKEETIQEIDIAEAKIVVCVGCGIRSLKNIESETKENIKMAKNLAKKMNAAFGSTRPLVDLDLTDQKAQIGQSGRSVKPDVYICFGVSGAIQHQVGMNKSKYIIAINSDPEAEIFEIANLGIVGDLFEIIPELIKKVG